MLSPTDWKNSGETITGLIAGKDIVTFKYIPSWNKPSEVQLTVENDQLTLYTGVYTIKSYVISATAEPPNSGNVSRQGTIEHGEEITLTAIPNPGYDFVNWTEDRQLVSTANPYNFSASAYRTMVANLIATAEPN